MPATWCPTALAAPTGPSSYNERNLVEGNVFINTTLTTGHGIDAQASTICANNRIMGFTTSALNTCTNGGGNLSN